jgi:hypothetical protein
LIADQAIGDLAEWHERAQSTSNAGTIRATMISNDYAATRPAVEMRNTKPKRSHKIIETP